MLLYLDNCCFNRPFDDQSQFRIHLGADYFLTTDDGIIRKAGLVTGVKITDPIGFIKEVSA